MTEEFNYKKRYWELFDDKAATGKSVGFFVGDCKEIELIIVGTDTAAATIKVAGGFQPKSSTSSTPIDFTSASSKTNQWRYQSTRTSDADSAVAGATGLVISANGTYGLRVNTNFVEWLAVDISSYTTGKFSVYAYAKY